MTDIRKEREAKISQQKEKKSLANKKCSICLEEFQKVGKETKTSKKDNLQDNVTENNENNMKIEEEDNKENIVENHQKDLE